MSPELPDLKPPRVGRSLLLRASVGALLVTVLAAVATATAGILAVDDLGNRLGSGQAAIVFADDPADEADEIDADEAGAPQTFLLLGSDRRWADLKKNNKLLKRDAPARSDTLMLVRMNPGEGVTSVMSVPRDLMVDIPGHGRAKINDAYSLGGEQLTFRTLKALLGQDFKIHHVVNVNFGGFKDAVNAVGCVYVDVDRRYYHSNAGLPVSQHYAEIDIDPGYQELCGQDALDYVRFRHADSDLVRAARQQDFLRAAKDQISTSALIGDRDKLIDVFAENVATDKRLQSTKGLLRVLKLGIFSAGKPVQEIQFPAHFAGDETNSYVEASQAEVDRTVQRFLHPRSVLSAPRKTPSLTRKAKSRSSRSTSTAGLVDRRRQGEDLIAPTVAKGKLDFPLYFPSKLTTLGRYATEDGAPRVYTIRDRGGKAHDAYRLVVVQNALEGQYYGIQGTTWRKPPFLAHPTSTETIRGRKLLLFRSGSRLRLIAWKTPRGVYWVSNTLNNRLTNDQMRGIASTLRRFGQ
ncbi:LCP family protein [Conexibacter sp. SYSU D00693]|uniref:LCP family protein n=1 Tax=Conexibacter sp. SYSU D00693 TaxID=2812560 RepID=UPI00196B2136|nr:LCP family protein [Conexibacter sp. SYSU D00693]